MGSTAESTCIEALREAAETLGKSPTKAEYEALERTPASATIRNRFGGWNAAKEAAGLETYEQGGGGSDIADKPDSVSLPPDVEWEELSSNQRWYYKNKDRDIERTSRRKSEIRRWVYEYKRDELSCAECEEAHPAALDFHHPGEKELGVAQMVNQGYSKESLRAEIDDCRVLCANCHRKHHFEEPPDPG